MKINKILPIALGLGLIVSAGGLVVMSEPEPVKPTVQTETRQPVSIVLVAPHEYRPVTKLLGTSYARWLVDIKSPNSAELNWLNQNAKVGSLVKQGEVLAQMDTTHLTSQLAQAHSLMKQAELNFQRELHEQTVALKMLSKTNSSAYARREPQIAYAKADLLQAEKAWLSAKHYLKEATIVAPFDAVILSRSVSPGQRLVEGERLFQLAASASLDVRVPIPDQQWGVISASLEQPQIQVIDKQGQKRSASVRYVEPQVDSVSRQRQVVLVVKDPYQRSPKLLPNQQLTVEVTLPLRGSVMQVPLSALTRDNQIWTVDDDNELQLEGISVLAETKSFANVVFSSEPDRQRRVVIYPLLSMIPGLQVAPEIVTQDEGNREKPL
ncbi:efflux RND transporter periplasmic adaptor subunit [Vibrio parahaemolyticus]|nr:efflux RND transporter periplasmic adaptor subunit [Vibrio parahaemolyticus]